MSHRSPAVVLLSGGLDSTTVLAHAVASRFDVYALTLDYGQRHRVELEAARRVAGTYGAARHVILKLDLRVFGGSSLTAEIDVPKRAGADDIPDEIPSTYVPARNTVMLSLALAWAEVLASTDIFIGVNAVDYSGYPDCRPEFIAAFRDLAARATKAGVEGSPVTIHTPLIALTKAQIITRGAELGVDYALTVSCYDPETDGQACGRCDACHLRRRGFEDAGLADPTRYATSPA